MLEVIRCNLKQSLPEVTMMLGLEETVFAIELHQCFNNNNNNNNNFIETRLQGTIGKY